MKVNFRAAPVPVLSIHVNRKEIPQLMRNAVEITETEVESYYVVADDARAGPQTRKLSFQEAIQLFTI